MTGQAIAIGGCVPPPDLSKGQTAPAFEYCVSPSRERGLAGGDADLLWNMDAKDSGPGRRKVRHRGRLSEPAEVAGRCAPEELLPVVDEERGGPGDLGFPARVFGIEVEDSHVVD